MFNILLSTHFHQKKLTLMFSLKYIIIRYNDIIKVFIRNLHEYKKITFKKHYFLITRKIQIKKIIIK